LLRRLIAVGTSGVAAAVLGLALPMTGVAAGAAPVVTPLATQGDGLITVVPNGNLYVPIWSDDVVLQITPTGTVTTFASIPSEPWAITSNAQGDIFVAQFLTGVIDEITPVGAVSVYASSASLVDAYGMAFAPSGNLFVATINGDIWQVTPGGTVSSFASGAGGWGLASDASGNLYSTNDGSTIFRISATGVVTTFATGVGSELDGVAVGPSGDVYVADIGNNEIWRVTPGGVVSTAVSTAELGAGASEVGALAFDMVGNLYAIGWVSEQTWRISGVDAPLPPVQLTVTESSAGTVSASWYGSSNDASYTCTLLYGFNDPSAFTQTSTTPMCSFVGLNPAVGYGVEVVANNGGASSSPAEAFAAPAPAPVSSPPPKPKHSIVCQKKHSTALRVVTAVNPRCPSGWHRVG